MIFIPGNVPSSKNSRIFNLKMKRSFPSKTTQTYIKESKATWIAGKHKFLKMVGDTPKPVLIGMHIVRKSKHKWDFHNAVQILCDLMKHYEWIDDDNTDEMFAVPFRLNDVLYSYNKDKPGVYIKLYEEC